MTVYFDGKSVAKEKEIELKEAIKRLSKRDIKPKLASILVGENPASKLYLSLKKKAAKNVGAAVEIVKFQPSEQVNQVIKLIKKLNKDDSVHGIMIQLPLPDNYSIKDRHTIINSIDKSKDVDGLRDNSPFLTPVVKAVLEILKRASKHLPSEETEIVVVGAQGFEGRKIARTLKEIGYKILGVDKDTKDFEKVTGKANVLISVTGAPNLIKASMVEQGAIVIDVGSPKADVEKKAYDKASFASPVPGGVGPVTISSLLENLLEAATEIAK